MPIYNETKLECIYETNKLNMHTTGVPTLKKINLVLFTNNVSNKKLT